MDSKLCSIFVPYIPVEGNTTREGALAESWYPFVNAFNTWMEQAQNVVPLSSTLACVRIGMLVCVAGFIKSGDKVDCVAPLVSFNSGNVLFNEEGYVQNNGDSTNINVTYIAKE